jgi:hypothetical protein
MAKDFVNAVMDMMIDRFPAIFNEGLVPGNKLYLKRVIKEPLQDDPTARAFYLMVSPDDTMAGDDNHWRMPIQSIRRGKLGVNSDIPKMEVGGGYKMINFFLIRGWLPVFQTRNAAYEAGGIALRRLEMAMARLANGPLAEGIATEDGYETSAAGYPQVFGNDGGHFELIGGETTWYPKLSMRVHVFSEIHRNYYDDALLPTLPDDDEEPEPGP